MSAQYILRFDDLCPTSNWVVWTEIERMLRESAIRPLLGVVPDNRDDFLRVGDADPRFWDRVRTWQSQGWTIGMHGYQHLSVTNSGGILDLNRRSEFAGLSVEDQAEKLRAALRIFADEEIKPSIFIAPNHSFDVGTLAALRKVGIGAISDGFSFLPHTDSSGMMWIPQQFWRLRWMPSGVWTICIHPNGWSLSDVAAFAQQVHRFRDRIVDIDTICLTYQGRRLTHSDRIARSAIPFMVRAKRAVRRLAKPDRQAPAASQDRRQ